PLRIESGTSPALPMPTPTRPLPSPTTTMLPKLNRRPPLTTLATRLICTTRSSNSGPSPSFCRRREPRSSRSISFVPPDDLELEAALAGALSDGLDPTVIQEATAIEDYGRNSGGLRPLRNHGADRLGAFRLRSRIADDLLDILVEVGRRGERVTGDVVDPLAIHMCIGPEPVEPWPVRRTRDLRANADVPSFARAE